MCVFICEDWIGEMTNSDREWEDDWKCSQLSGYKHTVMSSLGFSSIPTNCVSKFYFNIITHLSFCNKNQLDALISQSYSGMKLYMFRTMPLSIIRSLFIVHSAMVYVIQDQDGTRSILAVYKPAWYIPLLSGQWINSWWWTKELSETCRVSCQNKFVKLVHLVGFIKK
jgi:hypothetical protein